MLISHAHRFIFIKTLKTAGSSAQVLFRPACLPPELRVPGAQIPKEAFTSEYGVLGIHPGELNPELALGQHMTIQRVIRVFGREMWDDYFTFATVRNPWSKAVSRYFFKKGRERVADDSPVDVVRDDFLDFLKNVKRPRVEAEIVEPRTRVDFFIKLEDFDKGVDTVAERVGFELPPRPWERLKHRPRPAAFADHRALYTPTSRALVAEQYADWIDEFNYEF